MHFLTRLITGAIDEHVHHMFTSYGKGEFIGPVIQAQMSSGVIKIKSDFGYSLLSMAFLIENAPDDLQFKVTGKVIGDELLKTIFSQYGFKTSIKSTKGVFGGKVEGLITGNRLKELYQKITENPRNRLLISIKPKEGKGFTLTTKTSFPKPDAKTMERPEVALKFSSATLPGSSEEVGRFLTELVPEKKIPSDTKKIFLVNTYHINDLKPPEDPTLPPRETRLQTKRHGILTREIQYYVKSAVGSNNDPIRETFSHDFLA